MSVLTKLSQFAGKTFAIWVLLFAALALLFPEVFLWIRSYISILLGIVMFGMGMTLSLADFSELARKPKSVFIGLLMQFTIMPLLAYLLVIIFQLPPEIALGVILVGSCPGGTSSNVMTFLARGNIALSVAITSLATLLAPIVTPAIIFLLASEWLAVSFVDMFKSIITIVILPIVLGLIVKLILKQQVEKAVPMLPLVSVIAIVAIVAAVVSGSKEQILQSGLLIFAVVILHNGLGYLFGFLLAKLFKQTYADQKAISIEVGMQNSGLGATLATLHFSPLAAVPSAIFSFWHNISGPLLAMYWARKYSKMDKQK